MTPYVDPNDEIVQEHLETQAIEHEHEIDQLRDILMKRYPTPESAIEDVRNKELSDAQVKIRFSQEEIEYIYTEIQEREDEAKLGKDYL